MTELENIRLTEYSHGAGCGCKISPQVLEVILKSRLQLFEDENLLVGNSTKDDAAVYDLGNGQAVISTTDFFMPIVNDPFQFGQIAATNALSDVYAMGGKPILAIAILGWPINKLSPEVAQQVLDGGRQACQDAGISLAGGHSIDAPEPIFGLAATGMVDINNLKQNSKATIGSKLYLTKPLGVGVLTTAEKQGKLKEEHIGLGAKFMCKLNSIGFELGKLKGISALTDVTGFGFLGHLLEMCEGSGLTARIDTDLVPVIEGVEDYLQLACVPGGTTRNFASYGEKVAKLSELKKQILCDPQTSGGLLVAVEPAVEEEFLLLTRKWDLNLTSFGELVESQDYSIKFKCK